MTAKIVPVQINSFDEEAGVASVLILTRLEEREVDLEEFPFLPAYLDPDRGRGPGERMAAVMEDDEFVFFDTDLRVLEEMKEFEFMS